MKLEFVVELPAKDCPIVGITTFQDRVIIATGSGTIYSIKRQDGDYMLIKHDIYLVRHDGHD